MQRAFSPTEGVALVSPAHPDWVSFVESHPEATPFHHPAWTEVLAHAYGFGVGALLLRDGEGRVEAGAPIVRLGWRRGRRRAVSLPFTDWCPPLVAPGTDLDRLADRLEQARLSQAWTSLELRGRLAGAGGHPTCHGFRHVLALQPDPDAVFWGFHSSRVRRKLRRAEREGVEVRRGESTRDLLEVFYPLHVSTRRRLGVPVQPRRFFEALGDRFLERGLGFSLNAFAAGVPVASVVILAWNRRMIYKYSASTRELGDVGAGHAAVWDAVRWGCRNGYRELDFGRTDAGNEGLRTYKSAWGSTEHGLVYTTLGVRSQRPGGGRAERILGAAIRRSPELVTRAIGRVAYRYTA